MYNTAFQLNEMDFGHEDVKRRDGEGKGLKVNINIDKETDRISDVAKTFRNLRSQLMNQNRSRSKLNLNKIQSQKTNSKDHPPKALHGVSRNLGDQKMNTLSPKSTSKGD